VSIRFLADADLRQSIVTAVVRREPTIDFQSVIEVGPPGLLDPTVLAMAAEAGRRGRGQRHLTPVSAAEGSAGAAEGSMSAVTDSGERAAGTSRAAEPSAEPR